MERAERERDNFLISMLPETEHGAALFRRLREKITKLEEVEMDGGGKICDDPLIEDFRTQLGIKIGLKRVMREPQECKDELERNHKKGGRT